MNASDPGLDFIIVGASVAGLASALALKNSGHNVLVLEKDVQLGGTGSVPTGCARVPPNGTKILLDWGLEAEIKAHAAVMPGFSVHKYNGMPSEEFIGVHRWDPEMLSEARGGYIQFRHRDLLRILYNQLIKAPDHPPNATRQDHHTPEVTVTFGAEVVNVDCDKCLVTLKSGEVHTGDAIIGADGVYGAVRRALLEEEDALDETAVPTGLAMFNAIIPKTDIVEQEHLLFYDELGSTIWAGSHRGLMTCPVGKANDMSLSLYTPDGTQDGTFTEAAERKLSDVLGPCHAAIQKLGALAGSATCVQIKDHYELESWVSESGRVLVLGDAAHPSPPGAAHAYSVALEDGIFIGKVFSHTRNRERVPEFLYAFQEHREPRCARIRQMEKEVIGIITLPDGDIQAMRDTSMRANHAAGRNVMDGDLQQMLDDFRMVFGYDATDDAEEWWVSWGRFRDSSGASLARYIHDEEEEEDEDLLITKFQAII